MAIVGREVVPGTTQNSHLFIEIAMRVSNPTSCARLKVITSLNFQNPKPPEQKTKEYPPPGRKKPYIDVCTRFNVVPVVPPNNPRGWFYPLPHDFNMELESSLFGEVQGHKTNIGASGQRTTS